MIQTSNQELTRKIYLNDRHKNSHLKYPGNKVKTSKYNLWTFIPKCLYLQFMRVANLYFLMIAVLANTTSISSVSPITSVIPLVFVLATSLVREALEDYVIISIYRGPLLNSFSIREDIRMISARIIKRFL